MDFDKIKPGKRVNYTSRKNQGHGKVVETYRGETGGWVTVKCAERGVNVTVRASQVSPR